MPWIDGTEKAILAIIGIVFSAVFGFGVSIGLWLADRL